MILDALAIVILFAVWIFGGAAFFNNRHTTYKNVLIGWTVLNGFVVFACFMFYVLIPFYAGRFFYHI